jgi:hypothetical protein
MLEILSAHQRMLTFAALRLRRNATKSTLSEICLGFTIATLLMALDVSTAVYLLKNLADFAELVEAFYLFISVAMFLAVYLSFVLNKGAISELLNEIQIVVEMRKKKYIRWYLY